jgi:ribulose kinase
MEFLAFGLIILAIGGAVLAIVAFFRDEGGVEGRSINSVAGTSVATMSASDEGNAHSGVDGYHGGSYDGYVGGDGGAGSN